MSQPDRWGQVWRFTSGERSLWLVVRTIFVTHGHVRHLRVRLSDGDSVLTDEHCYQPWETYKRTWERFA